MNRQDNDIPAEEQAVTVEIAPAPEVISPQSPPSTKAQAKAQGLAEDKDGHPDAIPKANLDRDKRADQSTVKDKAEKPKEKPKEKPTQSDRDAILSQILARWTRPKDLAAVSTGSVRVAVRVMPDGYLADFFDARRPYHPQDALNGYDQLPPDSLERRTLESLYRAIRAAQPLDLSKALKAKAPADMRLDFRLQDVR